MPSPFAHVTSGYLLFRLTREKIPNRGGCLLGMPAQLLIMIGFSLLPDLDAIPGIFLNDIGRFHNKFSHSLLVGLLIALTTASLLSRKRKSTWVKWFMAVLTAYELHIIMDLFTGERGLMLLWPLTQTRFIAPVKLFLGVQWGLGLFSIWHVWTLLSEILFFIIFLGVVIMFKALKRKITKRHSQTSKFFIKPRAPAR